MPQQMGLFDVIYNCRAMRRLAPDEVPEPNTDTTHRRRQSSPERFQPAERALGRSARPGRQAGAGGAQQKSVDASWARHQNAFPNYPISPPPNVSVCARRCVGRPNTCTRSRRSSSPATSSTSRSRIMAIPIAPALGMAWHTEPVTGGTRARLGAAPTTLGLLDRDAVKRVLNLPQDVEAICLIPVGYPLGKFGPVTRLPVAQTLHWDRWS